MAGVAMENRLFRIHPSTRDTPFMEACAAFLSPKMSLSQVMPSGCHIRRVAHPPSNLPAVADRPSASDYVEEQMTVTPEEMRAAVTTPVFQPYRGETASAWMAKEYGITMDTSSLMRLSARTVMTKYYHSTLDLNLSSQIKRHVYHRTNGWTTISRDYILVVLNRNTTHMIGTWLCLTRKLSWT